MSLRFFADHCTPGSVIRKLQAAGYAVIRLKDYLPTDASDQLVISKAQDLDAVLISLNGDFADIVTYPPDRFKGILAVQIGNHPEIIPLVVERLLNYLATQPEMEHYAGKLLIVEAHRIRIRS